MTYLLDTHTFLWAIMRPRKLSGKASKIIQDTDNDICISFISFWEISLKYSIGKLEFEGIQPDDLPDIAVESGFKPVEGSFATIASFHKLPKKCHKDPFDRMLIWQSIRENMILVSKDSALMEYKENGLSFVW